jgi:hypothetical protein
MNMYAMQVPDKRKSKLLASLQSDDSLYSLIEDRATILLAQEAERKQEIVEGG